jgi:hypothetical protein
VGVVVPTDPGSESPETPLRRGYKKQEIYRAWTTQVHRITNSTSSSSWGDIPLPYAAGYYVATILLQQMVGFILAVEYDHYIFLYVINIHRLKFKTSQVYMVDEI